MARSRPSNITRREFVTRLGAGALAAAAGPALAAGTLRAETPRRKPNIIFILADDLGYGDLGCYGQQKIRTPNLDRLAAEGLRFSQCYAGSTICAPSRCALMTGLHTGHTRLRGNDLKPLLPEDVTVAEVLRAAGYTTGLVGKWGLGEPDTTGVPNRQGFDSFFGYLNQRHAHNYYPDYLWRNEEKVPLANAVANGVATKKVQYAQDLFAEEALAFVERSKDKPFFLYYAVTIPHANNEARNAGMEVPSDEPYSGRDWPQNEKNFAAMVTRLDTDIGRLMARLKELGLDDDTFVFFTSDNGPHHEGGHDPDFFDSSGPLRGIKRDLYEGGIRVPMIVRRPGVVPAGATSDHVWAFWDFLPTAADIAGAETPEGLDGLSVLPALGGEKAPEHKYLYWEYHERGDARAVRMGDWKAVRLARKGTTELYNLRDDLGETRDVAAAHPDIVTRLEAVMQSAHT